MSADCKLVLMSNTGCIPEECIMSLGEIVMLRHMLVEIEGGIASGEVHCDRLGDLRHLHKFRKVKEGARSDLLAKAYGDS